MDRDVLFAASKKRTLVKVAAFALLLLGATVGLRGRSPYLLSDGLRLGAALSCGTAAWLAGRSPAVGRWVTGAWTVLVRHRPLVVALLAIASFAGSAALCRGVLDPWPHVSDEVSYWFQARAFAAGRSSLTAPDADLQGFFPAEWVVADHGRWFSVFPPGWPLLLAIGVKLGVPWLVNPALGALALLVIDRLVLRLAGEAKALAATILCASSPFFLFMGASFMSHPASLLFTALSTLLLFEGASTGRRMPFVLSGCCSGLALLVRPLDAVSLWAASAAYLALRHRTKEKLLGTCLSALGPAAGAVVYVLYNHALSDRWLVPLFQLTSPHNRLGFGADVGLPWSGFSSPGHNPWRAALNLNFNLAVLSADLFGWPISSLCPALWLVCFGRLSLPHRWAAAAALGLALAYALYWYHGVCFGARFYFDALPALLVLTVEGLGQARAALATRWEDVAARRALATLAAFVVACFVFSATVYVPIVSFFEPYHNQWNVDGELADFVAARSIKSGIVFVGPTLYDYERALLWNALEPGAGDVIYAFERGADDEALVRRFPGRPVFHYAQGDASRPWPSWLRRLVRRGYAIDALRAAARHG